MSSKLMRRLCERVGVKYFTFHAIRHKAAAIQYLENRLSAAQMLLGHYRATTTDTYVSSFGLNMDKSRLPRTLADNEIGRNLSDRLEMEMPLEGSAQEAFCNHDREPTRSYNLGHV